MNDIILILGGNNMEVFAEFLAGIDDPFHRERTEEVLTWIIDKYPNLKNVYSKEAMLNYTIYVVFESPAYYISYATSMMGALYIDKMAQTNYDAAKEAYRKLIYNVDRDYNITDLYTKCGLGDPFDEETFNYIFSN